jgi:hypothetical protein
MIPPFDSVTAQPFTPERGGVSLRAEVVVISADIHKGDSMATGIADMLETLRSERVRARKELRKLEKAITVLRHWSTNSTPIRGKRRRMSAAARRKIAAAQRKRWAKFHQQRA